MLMDLSDTSVAAPRDWVDLPEAAALAGVEVTEVVDAITRRELRTTVTHPDRPGDWMVPRVDLFHVVRGRLYQEARIA